MRHFLLAAISLWPALLPQANAEARPEKEETPARHDARMKWWRDARFGMFIHWGVYSVPARGEWVMHNEKIPVAEYKKFAKQFNPEKFDADAWAKLAKQAGMKYMVITSKHHDGFAMYPSAVTAWDIADATPFKRDPLKELAEACRKQGIKLGFYYSQCQDWVNPGGHARDGHWDKAQDGDFMNYIRTVAVPQVRELMTNYGDVAVIWWDTPFQAMTVEAADLLKQELERQPQILMNNRLGRKYRGDFTTPENKIPAAGLNTDWETCMTMNDSWGFSAKDQNWKSSEDLLHKLIDTASKGGNFLLNIGPTSEGTIPEPSVKRLRAIGNWMGKYSESIYGTTASPFRRVPWGRCTVKENGDTTIIYAHVFDWPSDGKLVFPGLRNKILSARLLPESSNLSIGESKGFPCVIVPQTAPDPIASVVAIEIAGKPDVDPLLPKAGPDGVIALNVADVDVLHRAYKADLKIKIEGKGSAARVANWVSSFEKVSWPFQVDRPGKYRLVADIASGKALGEVAVEIKGKAALTFPVPDTGGIDDFQPLALGTVELPAGIVKLTFAPIRTSDSPPYADEEKNWKEISLKQVRLIPVEKP